MSNVVKLDEYRAKKQREALIRSKMAEVSGDPNPFAILNVLFAMVLEDTRRDQMQRTYVETCECQGGCLESDSCKCPVCH